MTQSTPLPAPKRTGYATSLRHVLKRRAAAVPAPAPAFPDGSLRIASYNIHKCVGGDGRFDPGRIRQVIRELQADILALQEVDQRFGDRAGLLDLALVEAETGLVPVPGPGAQGWHARAHGWHGNLILARGATVRQVAHLALPGLEPRGAVVADLDLADGRALRVIGAHFGLLRRSRHRQADLLARHLRSPGRAAVLMGDLNEWRIDGGSPLARHLPEGGPAAPPSFPARKPLLPLDRIIAAEPAALSPVTVHHTALARIASDHLPVSANWRPTA